MHVYSDNGRTHFPDAAYPLSVVCVSSRADVRQCHRSTHTSPWNPPVQRRDVCAAASPSCSSTLRVRTARGRLPFVDRFAHDQHGILDIAARRILVEQAGCVHCESALSRVVQILRSNFHANSPFQFLRKFLVQVFRTSLAMCSATLPRTVRK